jgi:hypothetical protein
LLALLLLAGASIAAHIAASFSRATIEFFPDEYIHSELSRSLAERGLPLLRGSLLGFPSLLEPILTAPTWLLGSVEAGFRASMVLGSVAMSMAAFPVYWLGRRLGMSGWLSFGVAVLTLATPSLLYSSWLMGEPFAYPLFVAGFAMGVLVLSGERRLLWPTLAVFTLCSLARIQLLILPVAFALTAVLFAAREHRLRRFLSERRYPIAALVLAGIAALTVPAGSFGVYHNARNVELSPLAFADRFATQLLAVLFACAWIVVPGALLGLWLCLKEPRSRLELAFACSALVVTLAVVVQTSVYVENPQERYVFYCAPVLALCLALLLDRGWPLKRLHALLVCPIFVIAAVLPLSTYAAGDRFVQSAFLIATYRLEMLFGVADGSLLVAIVVSAATAITLLLAFLPRYGGGALIALATALSAVALGLAVDFDNLQSKSTLAAYGPGRSWVDARIDGDHAYLLQGYSPRSATLIALFWNPKVDRVALLAHGSKPDTFGWPKLEIAGDGSLSVGGRPLVGPLLVDTVMGTIELRGAIVGGRSPTFALWLPRGRPRFALSALGFGAGSISPVSSIELWPEKKEGRLDGFVSFRVQATGKLGANSLRLSLPGAGKQNLALPVGKPRLVRIPVCSTGPWSVEIRAYSAQSEGDLLVSARSSTPHWQPDTGACEGSRRARVR